MRRLFKLYLIFLASALYFTWIVGVLILLLNQATPLPAGQFPSLFVNLLIYYGPLWFLFAGLIFFVISFFAERKFAIGFFSPPTFTSIILFTVFVLALVTYFNLDYYGDYLSPSATSRMHQLLLLEAFLLFCGTIFIFFRNQKARNWIQGLMALFLLFSLFASWRLAAGRTPLAKAQHKSDLVREAPRKLKIILMNGLSLNTILTLSSQQKLLNFDWIRQNGIIAPIRTFSPNFDLAVETALLTGQLPHSSSRHSTNCYQLRDVTAEFDIFPRYILFRNSAKFGLAAFYKKSNAANPDSMQEHYQASRQATYSLISPPGVPIFSEKNLLKVNTFIQFFPEISGKRGRKASILKKSFFLDDFLVRRVPNFKIADYPYFLLDLPGLDAIATYFSHYARPQEFPNLPPEQVQEFGTVLERYYQYYDSIIGKLITTMTEDEMLVIFSAFDFEALPLWRRMLLNYLGRKEVFVYKSNTAAALALLYEKKALKSQMFLKSFSIYDLYPTLLYYAGFALPKDLPGEVLRDFFTDRFILNNPIVTVTRVP